MNTVQDIINATPEGVINTVCVWVRHIPANGSNGYTDNHIVRLEDYYEDGTVKPRVEVLKEFMRPFYITKHNKRTHKQRKSRESLENLIKFTSTQSGLSRQAAKALGRRGFKGSISMFAKLTPYIYGTSVPAAVMIKHEINTLLPKEFTPQAASLTILDTETDVLRGNPDHIWIVSIANDRGEAVVLVRKEFFDNEVAVKTVTNPLEEFDRLKEVHMKDRDHSKYTMELYDTELDMLLEAMKVVRKWDTSYTGIFNIDFDIPKITNRIVELGGKLEDAFHDDSLYLDPYINYWKGSNFKLKHDGTKIRLPYSLIWNTFKTSTRTEYVDTMSWYRMLRTGGKELGTGYGLNSILKAEIDSSKLHFDDPIGNKLKGLDLHLYQQSCKQVEYCLYAVDDVVQPILLDQATEDLSFKMAEMDTDLQRAARVSTRVEDIYYYSNLKDGYVSCHFVLDDSTKEREDLMYGLSGWIIALRSWMFKGRELTGLVLKKIINTVNNSISLFDLDEDLVAAYPRVGLVHNTSLATTVREWCKKQPMLKHLTVENRRKIISSMFSGVSSSDEVATEILSLPKYKEIDTLIATWKQER